MQPASWGVGHTQAPYHLPPLFISLRRALFFSPRPLESRPFGQADSGRGRLTVLKDGSLLFTEREFPKCIHANSPHTPTPPRISPAKF